MLVQGLLHLLLPAVGQVRVHSDGLQVGQVVRKRVLALGANLLQALYLVIDSVDFLFVFISRLLVFVDLHEFGGHLRLDRVDLLIGLFELVEDVFYDVLELAEALRVGLEDVVDVERVAVHVLVAWPRANRDCFVRDRLRLELRLFHLLGCPKYLS